MESFATDVSMLCDPADARRHQPGSGGVKSATGHALVTRQAPHGNSATGDRNACNSIRRPHRVGTWNVRGLNQPGKLQIVENEMRRKNLSLLGLSETHWRGQGHFLSGYGNEVYFSGPEDESSKGVAFIVPPELAKCVLGCRPINDRIICLKLNTSPCKLNIIQVYAPTALSAEEDLEDFYGALVEALREIPKREVTMIIGDFNAKVGNTRDDVHLRRVVGKYGIGNRNDRGDRLLQFCNEESFTLTNTCFQQHIRRLYTWISPGDRYRNQIDFILIGVRWRTSITNVTTFPGADCGSDHQLLVATIRVRLKKIYKPKPIPNLRRVDLAGFAGDIEKRMTSLTIDGTADTNARWEQLKTLITQTARDHIPKKPGMKEFITPETGQIILERRQLKELGTADEGDRERYAELNREVQKRCRQDYNAYINSICLELEQNSLRHETKLLFRKVRELTETRINKPLAIEDENKRLLVDTTQVLERWKGYCRSLYDTDEPSTEKARAARGRARRACGAPSGGRARCSHTPPPPQPCCCRPPPPPPSPSPPPARSCSRRTRCTCGSAWRRARRRRRRRRRPPGRGTSTSTSTSKRMRMKNQKKTALKHDLGLARTAINLERLRNKRKQYRIQTRAAAGVCLILFQ